MKRVLSRAWQVAHPQIVTVIAMALVCVAVFMVWVPGGLVICALCCVVLERKVEIDHR